MSTLGLVPAGATIRRTYYAVPEHYSIGTEYETFISAARAALIKRDALIEKIIDSYSPTWENREEIAKSTADNQCVIHLRWHIDYPEGGGVDAVVDSTNVAHLTLEHCDKVEAREVKAS